MEEGFCCCCKLRQDCYRCQLLLSHMLVGNQILNDPLHKSPPMVIVWIVIPLHTHPYTEGGKSDCFSFLFSFIFLISFPLWLFRLASPPFFRWCLCPPRLRRARTCTTFPKNKTVSPFNVQRSTAADQRYTVFSTSIRIDPSSLLPSILHAQCSSLARGLWYIHPSHRLPLSTLVIRQRRKALCSFIRRRASGFHGV